MEVVSKQMQLDPPKGWVRVPGQGNTHFQQKFHPESKITQRFQKSGSRNLKIKLNPLNPIKPDLNPKNQYRQIWPKISG